MNFHTQFRWLIILLFFFLFSCNNDESGEELQSEYEYIKQNAPEKPVEKPEYSGPAFDFVPAEDYELFDKPYPTDTTEQVVVYEFFKP